MSNVEKYKCLCTKQIINLSSPCHVSLSVSHNLLLRFYDLLSNTRGENVPIATKLYFVTRTDGTGTCNRRVRESLEKQICIGLIIEAPSDEESRRERS